MWYVNVDGKEGWLPSSILRIMNEEELGGSATSSPSRTKLSSHGTSADASDFSDSDGKSLMIPLDCTLESDLIRLHGFFFFFFFFFASLRARSLFPLFTPPCPSVTPTATATTHFIPHDLSKADILTRDDGMEQEDQLGSHEWQWTSGPHPCRFTWVPLHSMDPPTK